MKNTKCKIKKLHSIPVLLICLTVFASIAAAEPPAEKPVSFMRDVRPILAKHCFKCHGPDEHDRKGDLRLDTQDAAFAANAFVPQKLDESEAFKRITSTEKDERMPPPDSAPPLSEEQIQVIRRWIEQGAKWEQHWSFERLRRPTAPA